ncbi:MAG TPA: acyloxyacyl hydrolase [Nitrospira sp.]|nr:acyloxyacyl hydrolase [Nitrospira sp.]
MGSLRGFLAVIVLMILAFTTLRCPPGLTEESTLISIGPRLGFSGKTPLLGRQQQYLFNLYDIAALWRLPWQWPLGESDSKIETRLITSAGALKGAGETGLIATLVPDLAFSAWNGFLSVDVGAGLGLFSKYHFGAQDFGGPVQIVATVGVNVSPIAHAYAGFRLQHFSDAHVYGPNALGVDLYIVELGYRF